MANTITENANQILDRTLQQLRDNTQITRFTPGSKARTLMAIISNEIERLEEILSSNIVLSLVNGAGGIYLDFIGELVGVARTPQKNARVEAEDRSVRIYTDGGVTFGELNRGLAIVVPAGTVLTSEDETVRYLTTLSKTLDPNETEAYLSVRSLTQGSAGNLAPNVLTRIVFEQYSTFPAIQLRIANLSSIDTGGEQDSDQFYRYKIANALLSAETGNLTSIRLAALSVQSVADLLVLQLFRGIGTADLILDTVNGLVSLSTIEAVKRAISSVTSLGMDISVRAPTLVGIELALDVRYARGLSGADKQQVDRNIRQAVSSLIAEVPLGGTLAVNSISTAIRMSDKNIADIGLPNAPLSELILWRDSLVTQARRPIPLQQNSNISLLVDERLTLEGSPAEAIRITEK